nr:uncharacterized protein LOC131760587 isoform X3 [Kogia breviceps]
MGPSQDGLGPCVTPPPPAVPSTTPHRCPLHTLPLSREDPGLADDRGIIWQPQKPPLASRRASCSHSCSPFLTTLLSADSLVGLENKPCSHFVDGRPETLRTDTVSWGPTAHRAPQAPGPRGSRREPAWPLSPLCCALRAPAAPKGQEHTQ